MSIRTRIKPGPSAEDIAHPYVLESCEKSHTVRLDMALDDLPFGPGGAACQHQQCGGRIIHIRDSRGYSLMVPDDRTPPDSPEAKR